MRNNPQWTYRPQQGDQFISKKFGRKNRGAGTQPYQQLRGNSSELRKETAELFKAAAHRVSAGNKDFPNFRLCLEIADRSCYLRGGKKAACTGGKFTAEAVAAVCQAASGR